MRIKCEYCERYIDDTMAVCPYCGGTNTAYRRGGTGEPKTIEELRAFCHSHNLPLEQMRFFIGEDYRGPRAYGIYRDGDGNFVVYKNKSDGSRAVRYTGTDEAFAVNELYQKMKAEITNQRSHQNTRSGGTRPSGGGRKPPSWKGGLCILIVLLVIIGMIFVSTDSSPDDGYYYYDNGYYYNQGSDWYYYNDDYWTPVYADEELQANPDDYYASGNYQGSYGVDDFQDSGYYEEYSSDSSWDDSDWDSSDWDWDSGSSWDSGWSDWDSDW